MAPRPHLRLVDGIRVEGLKSLSEAHGIEGAEARVFLTALRNQIEAQIDALDSFEGDADLEEEEDWGVDDVGEAEPL